ncbi:hypothetical protein ABIE78_003429 [Sinorhizobium fredii]|uniref:Uncharacterized protein n=1 Tax=Sinorhizobium fredii (strain USDA 257) TaxID=1185652 RepID=I3X4H1_SINF2|nr:MULTISPECIES: hypothetical protein [Sinorhizobium]AFL50777.1 hypothetical protein USDA257_c21950 [Sinorhizobium fredii USDA 257]PDT81101.1 hypothetical protein CO676_23635 [Sinorhizobium sp. BJ1]
MIRHLFVAVMLSLFAGTVQADESAFLGSLEGQWAGGGMVRVRVDRTPINVSCNFDSQATDVALSLKGTCRGLIVVSRSIGADLQFTGVNYSGTYVGPSGRKSTLIGKRRGSAINLTIHWAREVNGDRRANLTLQRVGENGMKLVTVDVDPRTGNRVVTSEINLQKR